MRYMMLGPIRSRTAMTLRFASLQYFNYIHYPLPTSVHTAIVMTRMNYLSSAVLFTPKKKYVHCSASVLL